MTARQAILGRCIDYAGFFPPAALDLETTVRNFNAYRAGGDQWALGQLVLPAGRARECCAKRGGWLDASQLSVILGANAEEDWKSLTAMEVHPDTFECKPDCVAGVLEIQRLLPLGSIIYFEVSPSIDIEEHMRVIAGIDGRLKLRTGGLTQSAFPSSADVLSFASHCIAFGVSFKATAGLHHAVRGIYPFTYEPDSPVGTMHGFLNVILAVTMLSQGGQHFHALELLEDSNRENFRVFSEGVRWRDSWFPAEEIWHMRKSALVSFGSCSFIEPLAELAELEVAECPCP